MSYKIALCVSFFVFVLSASANAQYYYGYRYGYPGRGYYSNGGYSERYVQRYNYSGGYSSYRGGYSSLRPSYRYDWSWGGGNRGYLGGRGGGWGGEW